MKSSEIYKKAQEFGINYVDAIRMRCVYLADRFNHSGSDVEYLMAEHDLQDIIHLMSTIKPQPKRNKEDEITDEMIERARRHPIELILEFTRGRCRCINPEHDDRDPSMSFDRRRNRAKCFACGHSVDSIAAYQHLHGCDFRLAVRNLS